MTEWTNPQYAAAVAAYREATARAGHTRPPRSRWGRSTRERRCSGCVIVLDKTGTPYTLPCGCRDDR